jgi:hypothetical protein
MKSKRCRYYCTTYGYCAKFFPGAKCYCKYANSNFELCEGYKKIKKSDKR